MEDKEKIIDRDMINKKANKLLQRLSQLLKNPIQEEKDKIEKIINKLEECAKDLQSEFLDDVSYIIKNLYNMGIKEN